MYRQHKQAYLETFSGIQVFSGILLQEVQSQVKIKPVTRGSVKMNPVDFGGKKRKPPRWLSSSMIRHLMRHLLYQFMGCMKIVLFLWMNLKNEMLS